METITLRRFRNGDEFAVSDVICTTLAISSRKDYSPAFIEENIRSHSPEVIAARAEEAHFYVAMDGETIIGCGGTTGCWGSKEESYLTSIFVLPDYQGKGVGRKIVEALEADEYFRRAWRTEVGSSLTAVPFYRKMGYAFKSGITDADEYGVVRLEKRKEKMR
ncbi:MAG: GNAT family N-acetyltransferase [Hominicoprocola sp.]